MENFLRVLDECYLSDLGFVGYPFTYSNRRGGEAEVRARLDRAVVTVDWRRLFPRSGVKHVHLHAFDHQLLVLDTENRCAVKKKRLLRFEVMRFDHPDFVNMVNDFWDREDNMCGRWSLKLKSCKKKLKDWNPSSFGNVQRRTEHLKKELEEVRNEEAMERGRDA
ncbi:unnamed protein product [Rhodiola kirilowii]